MPPIPARLRAWVVLAQSVGWTYDTTKDNHPRLTPPAGTIDPYTDRPAAPATFGSTPSDHRGDSNTVSYLRRLGVPIPRKGQAQKKGK